MHRKRLCDSHKLPQTTNITTSGWKKLLPVPNYFYCIILVNVAFNRWRYTPGIDWNDMGNFFSRLSEWMNNRKHMLRKWFIYRRKLVTWVVSWLLIHIFDRLLPRCIRYLFIVRWTSIIRFVSVSNEICSITTLMILLFLRFALLRAGFVWVRRVKYKRLHF